MPCAQLCGWAHIIIKNKIIKGKKLWLFQNQLKMQPSEGLLDNVNVDGQHTAIQDDAKTILHELVLNITTLFHKMLVVLMVLKTVRLFA